ncbi:hypothetical protein CMI38_01585 [Candidatus Pacearchaeota archaeon]|jgi:hypothetical protein|nr:hypothetical protein [Candidatus Pacearchaeota archaeon]|tara:strand:- start:3840 stop:4286 length:447 start_codon:yes stop_codon:yes gene_type:complete
MVVAQKIDVDVRRPYLIDEVSPGKFYIVKQVQVSRSDIYNFEYFGEVEGELNFLRQGEHISECPNSGIELVVECSKGNSIAAKAFSLIRKQALRDNYDYVSFQPYNGDKLVQTLSEDDDRFIGKVMPRLFTKVQDDTMDPNGSLPSQN